MINFYNTLSKMQREYYNYETVLFRQSNKVPLPL